MKELEKELAKKMIKPYYFLDENLEICFKIILESHNINMQILSESLYQLIQISVMKRDILL